MNGPSTRLDATEPISRARTSTSVESATTSHTAVSRVPLFVHLSSFVNQNQTDCTGYSNVACWAADGGYLVDISYVQGPLGKQQNDDCISGARDEFQRNNDCRTG